MALVLAGMVKSTRTKSQPEGQGRQTYAEDGTAHEDDPVLPPCAGHETLTGLASLLVDHQSNDVIKIH